ncbi:rod shape-determining protein MreD [Coxiella burnetii]|uniref:Rod shape-determining protein MreD n=1 Tax=Coxiella burnetii (strain Dugway 5J108-111) TaxID=434922 RepID=A9KBH5_COXBN|nr:rod shape-determining protein MreD [Coxiella burnetii]ABS77533.1 rod shape-determining protein [Coxiella burnetii Dugway 5J108-111]ACJ17958.1 rod shape-determining protein [Coxiella burnetii CbuG_Q212]ACJ20835.1 rod shape-determining protein [Coxiella burnetii CbuK_Q154]ATN66375.1 rod shape-determining protein MreD [Coxiella burnetii]ATN86429.1 rod shape-determining protein MreD [Coxiella burnetii str. Schperling]
MEGNYVKDVLAIGLTLIMAMMLTILPLPAWAVWYQPAWIFMVLLFWMIALPYRVGIGAAFIWGLLFDLLSGTILGQHALIFTIIAYFIIRFQTPLRSLPNWQQMILVFIATAVYLALQYWIMAMADASPETAKYWLPLMSTTLLWPWVRVLLKDYQSRFRLG